MKLDMNDEFIEAYLAMDVKRDNLFLTGKAGTGKSTLLRYFVDNTRKNVAVIAPTGIAALNVRGQTIHRFCGFGSDVSLDNVANGRYRPRTAAKRGILNRLDCLVVDEVSMLRADLLDCLQGFLSLYGPFPNMPFGGVQMIFVGDLYQLPPVLRNEDREVYHIFYDTPYFFSANCMRGFDYRLIELQKVYRQQDGEFVDLLNAFRDGTAGAKEIDALNQRRVEDPPMDVGITLTTSNRRAKEINDDALDRVQGESHSHRAIIDGRFRREYYPTDRNLDWKDGARIMLLNNDSGGRWVNGSMATIIETLDARTVKVKLDDPPVEVFDGGDEYDLDPIVDVGLHTWHVYVPRVEEETFVNDQGTEEKRDKLVLRSDGSFKQLPFKLAWAVTVHKSQGQTFDSMVFDPGRIFADGQLYTALSRVRSFEGLSLTKFVVPTDIRTSSEVRRFMQRLSEPQKK